MWGGHSGPPPLILIACRNLGTLKIKARVRSRMTISGMLLLSTGTPLPPWSFGMIRLGADYHQNL